MRTEAESTDAPLELGLIHSSVEGAVMELERRGQRGRTKWTTNTHVLWKDLEEMR